MRGPSWSAVILCTLLISLSVSLLVQWASDTGRLAGLWGSGTSAVRGVGAGKPQLVPSLLGLSRASAAKVLHSKHFLLVVRSKEQSLSVARDEVLSQEPLAGSELREGDQISVVLSLGPPEKARVPDVIGLSPELAEARLSASGLQVDKVQGPEAGTGERRVVSTDPPAGHALELDSALTLVVELAGVEVPSLNGFRLSRARKVLAEAGFKLGRVRERFSELREGGEVISQEPAGGTTASPGTEVQLVVAED